MKIICRLFGHDWRETSRFTGGTQYKCERCLESHTSFWACPSYRHSDDAPLFPRQDSQSVKKERPTAT
jgi:Fe-S oxidoreductase